MRKNTIIAWFFLILLFSACDLNDASELRINVSTVPVTVEKLHVAVLSGESIVTQKSFLRSELNSDGAVELQVEPGKNREVILVAEDSRGTAIYFGNVFADLTPGQVAVNIDMIDPVTEMNFATNNAMSPALKFVSWRNCGTGAKYYFREWTDYYWSGYDTIIYYYTNNSATTHYLTIEYEFLGIRTNEVTLM